MVWLLDLPTKESMFFFEKKNQKTFGRVRARWRTAQPK
jgi:hypothetical protein